MPVSRRCCRRTVVATIGGVRSAGGCALVGQVVVTVTLGVALLIMMAWFLLT